MELYKLDDQFRRIQVVDRFESLIWTERFTNFGDFQVDLHSNLANKSIFAAGSNFALNESYRMMTVETIEDKVDTEGRKILSVKGRSLEAVMENRMARNTWDDTVTAPKWVIEDLPAAIARKLFHDICVAGILDPGDVLPYIHEGSTLFPADTIGEPTETLSVEIEPMPLSQALIQICDQYNIGFRLIRNFDKSELYFDIYMGCDRTTKQSVFPAVVFSPDLENLQNSSELSTISSYKNVAYVISPSGHQIVYETGVDPTVAGFNRRVLMVNASDITDFDPAIANPKMIQRGRDELAKNRRFKAFDGEISQHSEYKYGVHYNLGDMVELRNTDGTTNHMQVTEQIFVSDKEGERSYPTLNLNLFILPGTWIAWDYNQHWSELGLTEYWKDQP